MLGLLTKDFRLLANQKQFFVTVLLIAVIFVLAGQDVFFVVSYCTMICTFFTISTISYDEYNNGFAFLFTMPITRRGYVLEKYLFGLLIGGGVWLATTVVAFAYCSVTEPQFAASERITSAVMIFLVMELMLCCAIPIQIKFGAEKGRVATLIFSLAVFGVVVAIKKIISLSDIHIGDVRWIANMDMRGWLMIGGIVFLAVVIISIVASIRIVEKKQF